MGIFFVLINTSYYAVEWLYEIFVPLQKLLSILISVSCIIQATIHGLWKKIEIFAQTQFGNSKPNPD